MGRKVNQKSFRISKNSAQKKQFNSLIKVLKPKVYIIDSSSFKRLVQELTGNGGNTTSSPIAETVPEYVPVVVEPETSIEGSIDASTDSFEFCNQVSFHEEPSHGYGQISGVLSMNQQANQELTNLGYQEEPESSMEGSLDASFDSFEFCNQESFNEESNHGYDHISGILSVNQQVDLLELESWLLDMDPSPVYDDFSQIQQGINIHDYGFHGLM
ncbi:hypothetical protein HS088_TW17G00027 [Tripterygium wilfordii]|uniref:VQ domain-containing protein n=1 Tax=Tripterygium wilfordii TaxID=458696 RepID=A0A7J7CEI6_TRIWF|nr:hypothetical protein HS088_TW17G00027 [Tripterygium wilfordii]